MAQFLAPKPRAKVVRRPRKAPLRPECAMTARLVGQGANVAVRLLSIGVWLAGCGAQAESKHPTETRSSADVAAQPAPPVSEVTPTTVVSPNEATDVYTLLAEAHIDLENQRFQAACERFERVVQVAEQAEERRRGLLGWGTCLDLG